MQGVQLCDAVYYFGLFFVPADLVTRGAATRCRCCGDEQTISDVAFHFTPVNLLYICRKFKEMKPKDHSEATVQALYSLLSPAQKAVDAPETLLDVLWDMIQVADNSIRTAASVVVLRVFWVCVRARGPPLV